MKTQGNQMRSSEGKNSQTSLAQSILTGMRTLFQKGFGAMGRGRGEPRMELLETLQLGGKRQLMLVLCDGQRYLVGAGGDSVHSIAEIERQPRASLEASRPRENLPELHPLPTAQPIDRELGCHA